MTYTILWLTPDACFVYANDAARRLLGYSREELLTVAVPAINPAQGTIFVVRLPLQPHSPAS